MILALLNLLGAKQANYAGCRHNKNLRVEIGQNSLYFDLVSIEYLFIKQQKDWF